jgi:hypothetical protein
MARTQTKKGRASHAGPNPPTSACLGNGIWQTMSWTRPDETFEQNLNERTCTCEAGQKGLWCKHLTAAFLSSMALQVKKARAADGVVVRGLLNRGVHQARPDIEMALLLVAWEEALESWKKLQAEDPGDEPEPEGAAVRITAEEYAAGVELLSEGRKVAA